MYEILKAGGFTTGGLNSMPKYVVKVLINMICFTVIWRDGYDGVGAENCSAHD